MFWEEAVSQREVLEQLLRASTVSVHHGLVIIKIVQVVPYFWLYRHVVCVVYIHVGICQGICVSLCASIQPVFYRCPCAFIRLENASFLWSQRDGTDLKPTSAKRCTSSDAFDCPRNSGPVGVLWLGPSCESCNHPPRRQRGQF